MSNEKRLQQIRNAARYKYPDERIHFIDGAKWADSHPQWTPVEEKLPEERKVVWVRKHFNKEVLGEFDIYDSAAFCNGEFQCDNSCNVTHWMPIVPPRKEDVNE